MPNIRLSIHKYCKIEIRKTSTMEACQQPDGFSADLADRMFPMADDHMDLQNGIQN